MKSKRPGKNTSKVELSNVTPHGLWLLIEGREWFLSFKDFPWFEDASIRALGKIEQPSPHHLFWPELDVDLAVESIEHPERFPLVSRTRPGKKHQPMDRGGVQREVKLVKSTGG